MIWRSSLVTRPKNDGLNHTTTHEKSNNKCYNQEYPGCPVHTAEYIIRRLWQRWWGERLLHLWRVVVEVLRIFFVFLIELWRRLWFLCGIWIWAEALEVHLLALYRVNRSDVGFH